MLKILLNDWFDCIVKLITTQHWLQLLKLVRILLKQMSKWKNISICEHVIKPTISIQWLQLPRDFTVMLIIKQNKNW